MDSVVRDHCSSPATSLFSARSWRRWMLLMQASTVMMIIASGVAPAAPSIRRGAWGGVIWRKAALLTAFSRRRARLLINIDDINHNFELFLTTFLPTVVKVYPVCVYARDPASKYIYLCVYIYIYVGYVYIYIYLELL